jgi:hypothetical protein
MILTETDDLRVVFEPGSSGTAVVSFTGVGFALGGIQKDEFVKTLQTDAVTHSAFYITDKTRSWYNRTREPILRHLESPLREFDRVVTLGNSMGGFGALYFSGLLPRCQRAISFVPQFSVDPKIIGNRDPRWMQWRSKIDRWGVSHALENMSDNAPGVVFFGANAPADQWHLNEMRVRLSDPHRVFKLTGCGHDVAGAIKSRGKLHEVVASAIDGASAATLADKLLVAGFALV